MRTITIGPLHQNANYVGPILRSNDIIAFFGLKGVLMLLKTSSFYVESATTQPMVSDLKYQGTPVQAVKTERDSDAILVNVF